MSDKRSELAAEMFPVEWAKIAMTPGASKKRQQMRQRAEQQSRLNAMKHNGKSCASCGSFRIEPASPGMTTPWCAFHSDFHGYMSAAADGLCLSWHDRTAADAGG